MRSAAPNRLASVLLFCIGGTEVRAQTASGCKYPAFPDASCTGWQPTGVTLAATATRRGVTRRLPSTRVLISLSVNAKKKALKAATS